MVANTILRTKLLPPTLRPQRVPRPQLTETFRQTLTVPLTLVSAPAGFGKTTATAVATTHLARQEEVALAWLTLEPLDSDPVRFWQYVFAAVSTAVALDPALAESLSAPQPPPVQALLGPLLNTLAAQSAHLLLVLDDLHRIDQPDIFEGLAFLLAHAPPTLHLVLVSRSDPPLALHQLRARGQLLEIRAGELRFDVEETAVFLQTSMGLTLADADIRSLAAQTEGWAAGLQLAGLALQGDPQARRAFIERLSHSNRYILDYLTEEVLVRQPQPVQTFLLQTSILDRLSGPLCDAVTQAEGTTAVLDQLAQQNLFLLPVNAPDAGWYRYHQLFAALLQGHLQQQMPEQVARLHGRAARWFAAEGDVETAIDHALRGADFDLAADLLEAHAGAIVMQGRARTVETWLGELPLDVLTAVARANLAFARALLLRGRYDAVEPYLQRAEQSERANRDAAFRGEAHALRATLADTLGDVDTALAHARLAIDTVPDENLVVRAMAQFALAGALRETGDVSAATAAYDEALPLCRAARLVLPEMLARAHLSFLCILQGQLQRAAAVTRPVATGATRHPAMAACLIPLAQVYLAWNQPDEAERLLNRARGLVGEGGHNAAAVHFHLVHGRFLRMNGDLARASRALDEAAMLFERGAPAWLEPLLRAEQVQVRLVGSETGGVADAEQLLRQHPAHAAPSHTRLLLPLAWARIRVRQATPDSLAEALALLAEVVAAAGACAGIVLEARVVGALAHRALGDERAARADLRLALALAEPEGHVAVFLEGGGPVAEMLRGEKRPFARQLLAAFPDEQRAATGLLPEPLTDRETEVLVLMARGLTYQQIADELIVSVNTVRHHVKGLYGKLEVGSRATAVEKARTLGLI